MGKCCGKASSQGAYIDKTSPEQKLEKFTNFNDVSTGAQLFEKLISEELLNFLNDNSITINDIIGALEQFPNAELEIATEYLYNKIISYKTEVEIPENEKEFFTKSIEFLETSYKKSFFDQFNANFNENNLAWKQCIQFLTEDQQSDFDQISNRFNEMKQKIMDLGICKLKYEQAEKMSSVSLNLIYSSVYKSNKFEAYIKEKADEAKLLEQKKQIEAQFEQELPIEDDISGDALDKMYQSDKFAIQYKFNEPAKYQGKPLQIIE